MKKTLIATALIASALSSQAFAGGDWFVGGEVGKARQDYSVTGVGSEKEKDTHFGVRIGKHVTDNVRVYGTLSGSKDNSKVGGGKLDHNNYQALISSDYMFGSGNVRPFVGLSAGVNKFELKGGGKSKSDTAAAYGAQAGVNWQVAKNWSVETGVQVLKHKNEFKLAGTNIKAKNDKTEKAYVSVQYNF